MVGPWERVARPPVWDSVPPGAGRRRNSRPEAGTGSPAVALARGGAMLRFLLPFAARRETCCPPGRRLTGQNGPETAAVCLCGRRRAGSPRKCGRPPQDRVPPRLAGHAWTGSPSEWPPGSPFADWPWPAAGGGQGRPKKAGRRPGGRVTPRHVDLLRLWRLLRVDRGQPGSPGACRGPACRCAVRVEGRRKGPRRIGRRRRRRGHPPVCSTRGGDGKASRPPRGLLRLVVDRTGPGWGLAVVCCKVPLGHSVFSKISFTPKQHPSIHGDRAAWRSIPMPRGVK
jgi:hypothetical protein